VFDNQQSRKRVLIVDFWQVTADTLETIFRQNGYDVRAAYSAEDALVIAEAWQPDVLISDIIMRDMNGLDLAKRLTALYPDCRVILISGQVRPEIPVEARALGFEYFDKPINPVILLKQAAALLRSPTNDSFR
jgi:CheY-like chemotaxis protein